MVSAWLHVMTERAEEKEQKTVNFYSFYLGIQWDYEFVFSRCIIAALDDRVTMMQFEHRGKKKTHLKNI